MMGKNLSTLYEIMGRKTNSTPSFIELDSLFIMKPFDVTNYYLFGKVGKLRQEMLTTNSEQLYRCIKKHNEKKAVQV